MKLVGTYFVSKATTKTGWRIIHEYYESGHRIQKTVPRLAWPALGFTDAMTLEQARARAKQINGETSIKRQDLARASRTASRIERDRLHHSVFVPEDVNQEFMNWLENNVSGSEAHLDRVKMMWATAKRIIISLQLSPEHYADNRKQFYRYFINKEYSLDYTKKVLRIINFYGKFCARLTGKFFEEIAPPKGHDRELINDAYQNSDSYYGPSEPLTEDVLAGLQDRLSVRQHAWLRVSLWFGLRPSELDMILGDRSQRFWRVEPGEVDVLWVYQPKLTSIPRPKRWKPIPILFDEQREALKVLISGEADKPLTKTLKKYAGYQLGVYAGRKGFTDLMLERGKALEDISQWMGHTSIEMTWKRYKDRPRVYKISK